MTLTRTTAATALIVVLSAAPSLAGIFDSPIPAPFTQHLYSVPGVINDGASNLTTLFSCTSTSTSPQTVGVEVFPAAGGGPLNNAATTALTVAPGATVTFATLGVPSLYVDQSFGLPSMKGSARILSTSKSLICSALLADSANFSPTSMSSLTVTKKTKQKGD